MDKLEFRKAWIALELHPATISRLNAAEQQQVTKILTEKPTDVREQICEVIDAAQRRKRENSTEEISNGFGVLLPKGSPDIALILSFAVNEIPGVFVKRVNNDEMFFSALPEHLELLRQKLSQFEDAGIVIGEGSLMREKKTA